jgi:hypothetical protein
VAHVKVTAHFAQRACSLAVTFAAPVQMFVVTVLVANPHAKVGFPDLLTNRTLGNTVLDCGSIQVDFVTVLIAYVCTKIAVIG